MNSRRHLTTAKRVRSDVVDLKMEYVLLDVLQPLLVEIASTIGVVFEVLGRFGGEVRDVFALKLHHHTRRQRR